MPSRTIKGPEFTIIVDEKRIIVKHIYSKGKRCRVIAPEGVSIESSRKRPLNCDVLDQNFEAQQTPDDVD